LPISRFSVDLIAMTSLSRRGRSRRPSHDPVDDLALVQRVDHGVRRLPLRPATGWADL